MASRAAAGRGSPAAHGHGHGHGHCTVLYRPTTRLTLPRAPSKCTLATHFSLSLAAIFAAAGLLAVSASWPWPARLAIPTQAQKVSAVLGPRRPPPFRYIYTPAPPPLDPCPQASTPPVHHHHSCDAPGWLLLAQLLATRHTSAERTLIRACSCAVSVASS